MAVYDLDGTITRSDTFVPFLLGFLAKNPARIFRCVLLPVHALAFWTGLRGNSWAKQKFLTLICGGASRRALADYSADFAARVCRNRILPGAVASMEAHRARGDRLVLITASPDLYVDGIARHLGFDDVIASKVAWRTSGHLGAILDGRLDGENCYGAKKVERLRSFLANDRCNLPIVAYSDHASDLPLLTFAGSGYVINPKPAMRELAWTHGLPVLDWSGARQPARRTSRYLRIPRMFP
ncbi:MAG: HAD-IB family hydrolase [Mesorhizobium sp.]|uniref:HAD family hydrolase n=1 Tax=Mesorhizobium sp. TaxID=1871066 RepID=UPI001ACF2CFB|nr:HAD-IB family hydrolase [Mesorhizobium sp.]MBN9221602.1 HAD-IB family hydrolase [Mesorhizobium sp.]